MKEKQPKTRVSFPIGAKLVIIITILFLASLGAVILMVSALSSQEAQKTAETNNFSVNQRTASQTEESIRSVQNAVLFFLEMMDRFLVAADRSPEMENYFFNQNRNIAAIRVGENAGRPAVFIPNVQLLQLNGINLNEAEAYLASGFTADEDRITLYNASPAFNISLITAVFPRLGRFGIETIKVLFTPYDLLDSFSTGINTSFLINSSGELMLHPDIGLVMGGANFFSMPIVEVMLQQGDNQRQISFMDGQTEYFGAYHRLAGIDAAVITTIPHDIVFEAVQGITRQNMYLALAVLFLTIIFILIFAKTISNPVRILANAALRIEEGYFDMHLVPQTRDEVGLLTESFDKMTRALSIFGRFTNRDIAVRSMKGEIKPGGHLKHATIFFSDIRDFTVKSENFAKAFGDDASNRIICWLNNYYTHMIYCIEKTGGVVDKFIGDGVMAHWGTASSAGSPAEDAYNCVKTALLMREVLVLENKGRSMGDPGNPHIHIGCGINTGMVTAGQLGSEQRMEYTVIGDAVNLASRLEGLNKSFGTDILITEDTWNLIGGRLITEEMLPVTVKGKEKPVRLFAVINFKDHGEPTTLAQVRELLGISAPDTSRLSIDDDEENKNNLFERRYIPTRRQETEHDRRKNWGNDSERTGVAGITDPMITMTSFGSSAVVQGHQGNLVPVFFSWNRFNFKSETSVIVEVALDEDFNDIIEEREVFNSVSVSIPLKDGQYWWRAFPVNGSNREPANVIYPSGDLKVDTNAKERIKILNR